jgi:hypothetical protein
LWSTTTEQKNLLGVAQKRLHHFYVWKPALSGGRALALKDLSFKIETITGLFAFPDRDVT